MVVKRDGTRELFDRNKILQGMIRACEKRPVSLKTLESVVDDIEREVHERTNPEVPAEEIGETVMARLKELDQVAYVRFASVYRQFKDVTTFRAEIQQLLSEV